LNRARYPADFARVVVVDTFQATQSVRAAGAHIFLARKDHAEQAGKIQREGELRHRSEACFNQKPTKVPGMVPTDGQMRHHTSRSFVVLKRPDGVWNFIPVRCSSRSSSKTNRRRPGPGRQS